MQILQGFLRKQISRLGTTAAVLMAVLVLEPAGEDPLKSHDVRSQPIKKETGIAAHLRSIYFIPEPISRMGAEERKEEPRHPELVVGERVRPAPGWTKFCEDYAPTCVSPPIRSQTVILTAEKRRELQAVNRAVNAQIKPKTDAEHWGATNERYVYRDESGALNVDKWDYAEDGYGDCEDYVLAKRKSLLLMGWSRSALLITVVRKYEEGSGKKVLAGHAVLTVKTSEGDLILDNMTNELKRWWETGYEFMKRQSEEDPNTWLTLRPPILARGN